MTDVHHQAALLDDPGDPARHPHDLRPDAADRGEPVPPHRAGRAARRCRRTSSGSSTSTSPRHVQYLLYVKGVFTLDFGPSLVLRDRTVNDIIREHFPRSIKLGVLAFIWAIVFGIPAGVIAALRPNTLYDYSLMFFSSVGFAVPNFLVATLLIYYFALKLDPVPTNGWPLGYWELDSRVILPSLALGLVPMAYFARLVRGTMLETMQQDYVRTARAKGLRWRRVVGAARSPQLAHPRRHGGRPAARLHHHGLVRDRGHLLDPGHRPLLRQRPCQPRLLGRDGDHRAARPSSIIVANLVVDILYGFLDPRTRKRGRDELMVVDRREERPSGRRPAHAPTPETRRARPIRQSSLWRDAYRRYVRNKGAVAAAVVFAIIVLYCLLIPGFWMIPGIWTSIFDIDPNDANFAEARLPPSLEHPFGTDDFGRDIFTRMALGRPDLDRDRLRRHDRHPADRRHVRLHLRLRRRHARQRDDALPRRALRPALPAVRDHHDPDHLNQGAVDFKTMVIALAIASWFITARIVRGQIITLKQNDYVRAAHAVGARWYRILVRHLLPNTLGVLIIAVFLELPGVVLGEAFLSFIGLGINPPDASWGSMAQEGRDAYRLDPLDIVDPERRHRHARALRELHRRRPPRRPRPAHAGDVRTPWRSSRSTTSRRTSTPARASSRRSTASSFTVDEGQDARDRRRVGLRQVGDRALDHGADPEAAGEDRRAARSSSTGAT